MRGRHPRITPAFQYFHLRTNPICAGSGSLRSGRLTWRFVTSPTAFSRCYRVRIDYQQDAVPSVFVDEPNLVDLANSRRLPHVYTQKPPRLCLYLPGEGEWTSAMRLDQTFVRADVIRGANRILDKGDEFRGRADTHRFEEGSTGTRRGNQMDSWLTHYTLPSHGGLDECCGD